MRRPTVKTIAEALGVSLMTVSNAINDKEGVSARTKKLVLAEVERQGYVPTQAARSLRTAKQWSMVFLVVDPGEIYIADYLTSQIVAGCSRILNDQGYNLLIRFCKPDEIEKTVLFRSFTVDGIIALIGATGQQYMDIAASLNKQRLPTIFLQSDLASVSRDAMSVRFDDKVGGTLIADHLAARDVKSVLAVVTEARWPAFEARIEGLQDGMDALSKSIEINILRLSSEKVVVAESEITTYLDTHQVPDAIFGGNDVLGFCAIRAVNKKGLQVPKDVLVTGFNALDFAQLFNPTLTTVEVRGIELGGLAANKMLDRLQRGSFEANEATLPITLKPGESTQR